MSELIDAVAEQPEYITDYKAAYELARAASNGFKKLYEDLQEKHHALVEECYALHEGAEQLRANAQESSQHESKQQPSDEREAFIAAVERLWGIKLPENFEQINNWSWHGWWEIWQARGEYERAKVADYEAAFADHRRLVRKIDVILNGEEGAAQQASLCDLVGQIRELAKASSNEANPDVLDWDKLEAEIVNDIKEDCLPAGDFSPHYKVLGINYIRGAINRHFTRAKAALSALPVQVEPEELKQLLTDMRCEVDYTSVATMSIPLYERIKAYLTRPPTEGK